MATDPTDGKSPELFDVYKRILELSKDCTVDGKPLEFDLNYRFQGDSEGGDGGESCEWHGLGIDLRSPSGGWWSPTIIDYHVKAGEYTVNDEDAEEFSFHSASEAAAKAFEAIENLTDGAGDESEPDHYEKKSDFALELLRVWSNEFPGQRFCQLIENVLGNGSNLSDSGAIDRFSAYAREHGGEKSYAPTTYENLEKSSLLFKLLCVWGNDFPDLSFVQLVEKLLGPGDIFHVSDEKTCEALDAAAGQAF